MGPHDDLGMQSANLIPPATEKEVLECEKLRLEITDLAARRKDESTKRDLEIAKLRRFDAPTWVTLLISVLIATGGWSAQALLDRRAAAEKDGLHQEEVHSKTLDSLTSANPAIRLSGAAQLVRNRSFSTTEDQTKNDVIFLIQRLSSEADSSVREQLIASIVSYGVLALPPLGRVNSRVFDSLMFEGGTCYELDNLRRVSRSVFNGGDPNQRIITLFLNNSLQIYVEHAFRLFYPNTNRGRDDNAKIPGLSDFESGRVRVRSVFPVANVDERYRASVAAFEIKAESFRATMTALNLLLHSETGHLAGVDLSNIVLMGPDLDLSKLDLSRCILRNIFIIGDAHDMNLTRSDLAGANLSNTKLERAIIKQAKITNTAFGCLECYAANDRPSFDGSNLFDATMLLRNGERKGLSYLPGLLK